MNVKRTNKSDTEITLTIIATEAELSSIKQRVLGKLAKNVKVQGFRTGTAPASLVEKNIDQSVLQTEFLDEAMTQLYGKAAQKEKIRPVTRPDVQIKKFVPFTSLEFDMTTSIIGDVKLPNYKVIKVEKPKVTVVAKDVDEVVKSLQTRGATQNDVDRSAKSGDQVVIDFLGKDKKGEPVAGADGKDYPLVLGSNTFIPGFEDNLVGMKAGEEKTFTLKFPKDYGVSALASKDVAFTVTVKKVQELVKPEVNDAFASTVGPFKTVKELKDDIKKQLTAEREAEATRNHQNELIGKIVDKTTVALPQALIDQQVVYNIDEVRRNLTYKGQTFEEFLKIEGTTEDEYKKKVVTPQAERQLKTSIVLSEIAEKEKLTVTPEELEIRIQLLKGQYAQDQLMQAELDKPENRQDISQRMLTEKVLALLSK